MKPRVKEVGCRILQGPQDWQILQRDAGGFASLDLQGTWRLPDEIQPIGKPVVLLRVVREADGAPVSAALDWKPAATRGDGTWRASLRLPAGGLYRLETGILKGPLEWAYHGDFVHHLGVGDLWVIAGQSNAAGYGRGAVQDPPELGLHLLRNDETWGLATHPLNDTRRNSHANLETSNPGHSPFLAFARVLQRELGYPIGLVQTALGGSPLSQWNIGENPQALLYRNLLHCVGLAGGRVTGMVWYQGESDSFPGLAETYLARFGAFVRRLRKDLRAPRLPVLTAQLNRHRMNPVPLEAEQRGWSRVKEAQRQAARVLPRLAVVGTADLPLGDLIHTSSAGNLILGERFARAALGLVYGKDVPFRFPDLAGATMNPARDAVRLRFGNLRHRLHADGPIRDFTVEDDRGPVPIREAGLVAADTVLLKLGRPLGKGPRVHGGLGRDPQIDLYEVIENRPPLGFYDAPILKAPPRGKSSKT